MGGAASRARAPTHAVDTTDHLRRRRRLAAAHEAYIDGLGRDFDPDQFLHSLTARVGAAIGVAHAVAFEHVQIQGV